IRGRLGPEREATEEDPTEGEREGKTPVTHGFSPGFPSSDPSAGPVAEREPSVPGNGRGFMVSVRTLQFHCCLFFVSRVKDVFVWRRSPCSAEQDSDPKQYRGPTPDNHALGATAPAGKRLIVEPIGGEP